MKNRKLQTIVVVVIFWGLALLVGATVTCRWLWSLAERFNE